MKPNRRLSLRRETLSELSADELTFGAGIAEIPSLKVPTACSLAEYNAWLRDIQIGLTVHQRCTWSCI